MFAPKRCRGELGEGYITVAEDETFTAGPFEVTAVPAYNTPEGRSTKKQHKRGDGLGYVLRADSSPSIYHAGDTDVIPEMAEIDGIDWAFLPVGGTFTMDSAEAVEAAALIEPGRAFPMHYREASHADEFVEELRSRGRDGRVVGIGETIAG